MKIIKRILFALLIVLILALIGGGIVLHNVKTVAIPDYNKNLELPGLAAEAHVLRDVYGVPHVYAENENDLYYAVGYTMAQDRMWQMDLLRRVTMGQLSEILGKDQVNTDLLMRALRITAKSEKILQGLDPEITRSLENFSKGVNHYIQNNPLPPEFRILKYQPELWKPVHSLNLVGYMAWDLSMGWGTEYFLHQLRTEVSDEKIAELIPDLKNHKTAVYPEFGNIVVNTENNLLSATQNLKDLGIEIFNGSNNWAVSAKKSKSGKPLLANDMHLGLFSPGIWYQMHMHVEGKINVTGVVLPGQPFVIAGHNQKIAWGMTNVMVDDLDFYAETLNSDSTKYLFEGQWKAFDVRTEQIKTKEGETIEKELKFTHRGPVVNQFKKEKETVLSIRWLGNEMSNEIRSVYLLNRAQNWTDFRDAVKTFKAVSQNIVYADVDGNIGLQCSAGVPMREGSGIQIYPGDSSKYDWQGLVPFEELPYEFNPERGYVSSANNKTAPENYPHYISHWFATPSRIDRIREMLEAKEKLGIEDFKAMHADFTSKTAEHMTKVFVDALQKTDNRSNVEEAAFQKLKNWDYNLTKESQAASIFEVLYRKTMENLVVDELSPKLYERTKGQKMLLENLMINLLAEKESAWIDNINTEQIETFDDIVVQSFNETVEDLSKQFGDEVELWNWGKLHSFSINHPLGVVSVLDKVFNLNRGPFEMPGSYHTVCPYSYSFTNLYKATHGASHRHIYDLKNWDHSLSVIPTGVSGIPASDFYLNQTEMYINNQYHPDWFSKSEVTKAAKYRMKITPK